MTIIVIKQNKRPPIIKQVPIRPKLLKRFKELKIKPMLLPKILQGSSLKFYYQNIPLDFSSSQFSQLFSVKQFIFKQKKTIFNLTNIFPSVVEK
jgi:hypothetical protein